MYSFEGLLILRRAERCSQDCPYEGRHNFVTS